MWRLPQLATVLLETGEIAIGWVTNSRKKQQAIPVSKSIFYLDAIVSVLIEGLQYVMFPGVNVNFNMVSNSLQISWISFFFTRFLSKLLYIALGKLGVTLLHNLLWYCSLSFRRPYFLFNKQIQDPKTGSDPENRQRIMTFYLGDCPQPLDFLWWLLFSPSVMSSSLWPYGWQHTRLPCPSPSPGTHVHWVSNAIQPSYPLPYPLMVQVE